MKKAIAIILLSAAILLATLVMVSNTSRTTLAAVHLPAVVPEGVVAAQTGPDPVAVRTAAKAVGLDTLKAVNLPPVDLTNYINPGPDVTTRMVVLGKALFWDQQVGSDGQACASCHFAAGADNRTKNQLNPGLRETPPNSVFGNPSGLGGPGFPDFGLNATLDSADFPWPAFLNNKERDFNQRNVVRDTDDVTSSQGVFTATYTGFTPGQMYDNGTPVADPIFNVGGVNVRVVAPRNAPTMINAVFNVDNFWDGRAKQQFNGVSPLGPLDTGAKILVNNNGTLTEAAISIDNSSLASQAVGPVLSTAEMSFAGRIFPDVGKKLLNPATIPLGFQLVHPQDSVLGPLSLTTLANGVVTGDEGLNTTYKDLIQEIFQPKYWNSTADITIPGGVNNPYTQMEANFSLFWGLAIQAYERTLVSDDSPFDKFMEGDNTALTPVQLKGLLVFINEGRPGQIGSPLFSGVGSGVCSACHAGPETTEAAFTTLNQVGKIEIHPVLKLSNGLLAETPATALVDTGYHGVGTRATQEDLGRGGTELNKPLSWTRQAIANKLNPGNPPFPFAPSIPTREPEVRGEIRHQPPLLPPADNRDGVNAAFKIPGLRNIELTGPYMHAGNMATLSEVAEFYDRHGDFGGLNPADIDPDMALITLRGQNADLVAFLLSLTDERVRNESAPFDHPQLFIPNGHPGDLTGISQFTTANGVRVAADVRTELPAVGTPGRKAQGLPPVVGFPRPSVVESRISITPGWSLLSTPTVLDAGKNTLGAIFDAASRANIEIAYSFENGVWVQRLELYELTPLSAIAVKVKPGTEASASFAPSTAVSAPPSRRLPAGSSLIGPAPAFLNGAFQPMPLNQALTTIVKAAENATGYTKVISPAVFNQPGWEYAPGGAGQELVPFKGYFVVMDNPDTLFGFSTTPIVP